MRSRTESREAQLLEAEPIVVLGMHRSGTSMTTRLLIDAGVYMGRRLTVNCEPPYFRRLNEQVFSRAGAAWSDVRPLVQKMQSPEFIEVQRDVLRRELYRSGGIAKSFEPDLWQSILRNQPVTWGFKDPRTTMTFPIWFGLFPKARFVHVIRDGIAVAVSLIRRTKSVKAQWSKWWRYRFAGYGATLDFRHCFALWEDYVSFALEHKHLIPPGQYVEVRYEDLLRTPHQELGRLLRFLRMPVDNDTLRVVCGQIDRGRLDCSRHAEDYRHHLATLAASPLMRQLGYQD